MPVKSYLVTPVPTQMAALRTALAAMPECEVMPATNQELLILVTDTPDEDAEKRLEQRLLSLDSLQCLALVAAYQDEE